MRLVLVGQAPSHRGSGGPLEGRVGREIARLAGWSYAAYLDRTERRNLFKRWPGKDGVGDRFNRRLSKRRARKIMDELMAASGDHLVVCVGLAVGRAFDFPPLHVCPLVNGLVVGNPKQYPGSVRYFTLPHPSGESRWYNDPLNRQRAAEALRRFLAEHWRSTSEAEPDGPAGIPEER